LLKIPSTAEGLENFPTPRSWTWIALDLKEGFNSLEDICGLVGEEVGRKFDAFLKLNVDIEDLIREPKVFHRLSFDAKYVVPIMLANWISQHQKSMGKAFPLIDEMTNEKHEFLVMTCVSMKKRDLVAFLKELFTYKPMYRDILSEIALEVRNEISPH